MRPGGSLLYTTCTFSAEENEGVIAAFLRSHPEFELVQISQQDGLAAGYSAWSYGNKGPVDLGMKMEQTVRSWPQRMRGEGHFLALLRRNGEEPGRKGRRRTAAALSPEARRLFDQFSSSNLSGWSSEGALAQHGAYLYRLPEHQLNLKGLHVIHPGLWLGTLKKNRFEPSQALAMSLKPEQAARVMRLGKEEALGYLQGRSLPAPQQEDGWVLMTIDNFPLGWGKCSQGILKNYYPHGLRWQG